MASSPSLLSTIYILLAIWNGFNKSVKIMVFDHIWSIISYHVKARQNKEWSVIFKYKIANDMEMQDKAITGRNCRHYKAMADSPQTSSFDLTWPLVFIFNSLCYIGSLHLFDRMALIPAISWWSRSSWTSWPSPSSRVAGLGRLSVGAKMAMKPFVKRVFTIFATIASFLRVISNFWI